MVVVTGGDAIIGASLVVTVSDDTVRVTSDGPQADKASVAVSAVADSKAQGLMARWRMMISGLASFDQVDIVDRIKMRVKPIVQTVFLSRVDRKSDCG